MAWSIKYSPVNVGAIFEAAFNAKRNREMQNLQLEGLRLEQQSRQQQFDQRGAEFEQKMRASEFADKKQRQDSEQKVRETTAGWGRFAASALKANPNLLPVFQRQNQQAVSEGRMLPVDFGDLEALSAGSSGELAAANKLPAEPEAPKPDETVWAAASRISPQDPRRGLADPNLPQMIEQIRKEKIATARAGASNISMGGKPLPAASVIDLSAADASISALDNLHAEFKRAFPQSGTVAGRVGAVIQSQVPFADSDAARFENLSNMTTQIVGKALEGGVLKEADFARYKSEFMIKPGDSEKTADWKTAQLKALIRQRASEARKQLKASGYNSGAPVAPEARAAELAGQGMSDDQIIQKLQEEGY